MDHMKCYRANVVPESTMPCHITYMQCHIEHNEINVKSSFPKRDKLHSKKKWAFNVNTKFIDCVLEKSLSCMTICINIFINMYTYW